MASKPPLKTHVSSVGPLIEGTYDLLVFSASSQDLCKQLNPIPGSASSPLSMGLGVYMCLCL